MTASGVGELADLVARDYTTVSGQVAEARKSGRLVKRRPSNSDKRVSEATITAKGAGAMTNAPDAARERVASLLLADWSKKDLQDLARLMRRFADDLLAWRT